jgi:hypothetical protein
MNKGRKGMENVMLQLDYASGIDRLFQNGALMIKSCCFI